MFLFFFFRVQKPTQAFNGLAPRPYRHRLYARVPTSQAYAAFFNGSLFEFASRFSWHLVVL
jgi:hypothetical protein